MMAKAGQILPSKNMAWNLSADTPEAVVVALQLSLQH